MSADGGSIVTKTPEPSILPSLGSKAVSASGRQWTERDHKLSPMTDNDKDTFNVPDGTGISVHIERSVV